ncbi:hypothetical protein D3C73_1350330 [compost metagenome]
MGYALQQTTCLKLWGLNDPDDRVGVIPPMPTVGIARLVLTVDYEVIPFPWRRDDVFFDYMANQTHQIARLVCTWNIAPMSLNHFLRDIT